MKQKATVMLSNGYIRHELSVDAGAEMRFELVNRTALDLEHQAGGTWRVAARNGGKSSQATNAGRSFPGQIELARPLPVEAHKHRSANDVARTHQPVAGSNKV